MIRPFIRNNAFPPFITDQKWVNDRIQIEKIRDQPFSPEQLFLPSRRVENVDKMIRIFRKDMLRCLLSLTGKKKGVNQVSLYFVVKNFLTKIKSLCDFMVLSAGSV